MYKIAANNDIIRISDGATIPKAPGNRDYNQLVANIQEHGTGIVEGADVIEPDYIALRTGSDGYASIGDQLDVLTQEGIEAFQALNNAVKEKYPKTITGGTSIAALPSWVEDLNI